MNRRAFLGRAMGAAASLACVPQAFGAWEDGFDTGNATLATRFTDDPILSQRTLAATREVAALYEAMAARGGWPAVPWSARLSLGTRHPQVADLRRRLAITGDLSPQMADGDVFDSYVDAAVRRAQARHGLRVDGVAGPTTQEALNVSADVRAGQLRANLPRIGDALVGDARQVTVNVPSAEIELVEDGRVAFRHTAVVGKADRATPLLSSAIHEVNFNPTWTVPRSIVRKDLLPIIRKDPNYLREMGMRIFDGSWNEIDPATVDFTGSEAEAYFFRQDPGSRNALGRVRINFANDHQVYLHDTPQPGLFGDASRFHSSGCVRIQNIPAFVAWLLRETPGWDEGAVASAISSGERRNVSLSRPVPVHFVYVTAWAGGADLTANFREDIYGLLPTLTAADG